MTKTPHEIVREALESIRLNDPNKRQVVQALALLDTHVVVPRELTKEIEAVMRQCEIEPCLTMVEAWRQMIAAAVRGE